MNRPMKEETCAVCGRYTCADPDCNTHCCQPTLNNGNCTMVCKNCISPLDDVEYEYHRCLADENSCVEGKACPYYVTKCNCKKCEEN